MRQLTEARRRGREYRELIDRGSGTLCARIVAYLETTYQIELVPLSPEQMLGSKAEIVPAAGVLKYDRTLPEDARTLVFAHELGHMVLHSRLTNPLTPPDPILGSVYAEAGAGALARYSPRTAEEAEATAFAVELLCPSDRVFADWRTSDTGTSATIAERYGIPVDVARAQLAQGLHDLALGVPAETPSAVRRVELTLRQREAATATGRPILVDAGPGTGKTATLVGRVRFLLESHGAQPEQCLILTFSNEAAEELRGRMAGALGDSVAARMTIATFHGFGMTLLHHHGQHVGYGTEFSILDHDVQCELVTELLGSVPCEHLLTLRDPRETAASVVDHINQCKQRLRDTAALAAMVSEVPEGVERACAQELLALYEAYEEEKLRRQAVDFADLILLPMRLLTARPDIVAAYQQKYPWVLVDEFQDVTRATSDLLRTMCGAQNPPWVVGDARQAIYRFLGAAPENVSRFDADFPGAQRFELEDNYRSAGPIVDAANALADLMMIMEPPTDDAPAEQTDKKSRWRAAGGVRSLEERSVVVARAASDSAEMQGVADQVGEWLSATTLEAGDIAILARRNIDVRNAVLALGKRGIRAQASALLTAEGAAGGLAAVLSVADGATAAWPRVAMAVRRAEETADDVNAAIRHLIGGCTEETPALSSGAQELALRAKALSGVLVKAAESADGFATLAIALFDTEDLLRPLLARNADAETAMALVEIVSTLYLAAGYRISHLGLSPREARLGFGERLREQLTEATSLPLLPQRRQDTVRVMTCHASKGLEFPCVIVMGQSAPRVRERFKWLPAAWRPSADDDVAQGDALLFVAATRAERGLVVSYPMRGGDSLKARTKAPVRLLEAWLKDEKVPTVDWTKQSEPTGETTIGALWGGTAPEALKATALDKDWCAVEVYLTEYLRFRFPDQAPTVYPAFVAMTRNALQRVAAVIHQTGEPPTDQAVSLLLDELWPERTFAGHPHRTLYRRLAERMTRRFAAAYGAVGAKAEPLERELGSAPVEFAPKPRLDLIVHARLPSGPRTAVAFRSESLVAHLKNGGLNWSVFDVPKRLPFVLLENESPGVHPLVFSGTDGQLYPFRWSKSSTSFLTDVERASERLRALANDTFTTTPTAYQCDACRLRIACPLWMGLGDAAAASGDG